MGDETQIAQEGGLRDAPISTLPPLSISAALLCVESSRSFRSARLCLIKNTVLWYILPCEGPHWRKLVPLSAPLPFTAQSRKWATIAPQSQLCLYSFIKEYFSCTTHVPAVCWNVLQLHRAQVSNGRRMHSFLLSCYQRWVEVIAPQVRGRETLAESCFIDCHAEWSESEREKNEYCILKNVCGI